ncbi:hypothetical protein VTO42DRAFT_2804 [Malbranchea cinnamomea]
MSVYLAPPYVGVPIPSSSSARVSPPPARSTNTRYAGLVAQVAGWKSLRVCLAFLQISQKPSCLTPLIFMPRSRSLASWRMSLVFKCPRHLCQLIIMSSHIIAGLARSFSTRKESSTSTVVARYSVITSSSIKVGFIGIAKASRFRSLEVLEERLKA